MRSGRSEPRASTGSAPREKKKGPGCGSGALLREARPSFATFGNSALRPSRASVLSPGSSGAPPANPSLASGLVARCAHYRIGISPSQVAQSSDSDFGLFTGISLEHALLGGWLGEPPCTLVKREVHFT